jgi:hypothetical protein
LSNEVPLNAVLPPIAAVNINQLTVARIWPHF